MQSNLFDPCKAGRCGFNDLRISTERRNRIRLSVAAYAYEIASLPTMTDEKFDNLARKIQPSIRTGFELLDDFFAREFTAHSGMWIHKHPELQKIASIYKRYHT